MTEGLPQVPVAEQAEQDPTKAAALAWASAASTYAGEQRKHFDKEGSRALGPGNNWSRPGPVPAGFNGTEIDRQILQAEGSYDEDEEPAAAQEDAARDAEERSEHYSDVELYFNLVRMEIEDNHFDFDQEARLAELESQRQAAIKEDKPDIIGQQVDAFEATAQIRFADEIRAIENSQWYRDQDPTDHYAH